jgi:hypothetical protein
MGEETPKGSWVIVLAGLLIGGAFACLLVVGLGWWASTQIAGGRATVTPLPPTKPVSGVITATLPVTVTPTTAQGMAAGSANLPASLADIPLPEGIRPESAVGDDTAFSLITQLPQERVVQFFLAAMLEWGWEPIDTGTRLTPQTAELHYTKNSRQCTLIITRAPFVGTIVFVRFF